MATKQKQFVFTASTNQEEEFLHFVRDAMLPHIKDYCVAQWGDSPDDRASQYTREVCMEQAGKYVERRNSPHRTEERDRDVCKAVHYLQRAWAK